MMSSIANRLARIHGRIEAACRRSNRNLTEVRLVAVTKHRSMEDTLEVLNSGENILGENRIQEAVDKIPQIQERIQDIEWHLIGHLQRNKARLAVSLFQTIHSLDSLRLAEALEKEAAKENKQLKVLLQINIARESQKDGLAPEEAEDVLRAVRELPHLNVCGLMTMAPFDPDPEHARPVFRELRRLRDDLRSKGYADLNELSMGMTQDYPVAIEEGATLVRIGTAIFED